MTFDTQRGQEPPLLRTEIPGPTCQRWLARASAVKAPMGPVPRAKSAALVYSVACGANVWDPDGNRYVDLCAGFGSVLLGHCHPELEQVLAEQQRKLTQALGDLFDSEAKIEFLERVTGLHSSEAQGIVGLSGSDAVSAAIKTAVLATGRSRLIAFDGSYHGLSYGPLAVSGLRDSYRAPFVEQLNPHVTWLPFPAEPAALEALCAALKKQPVAAVLLEPILGRGGVHPLNPDALAAIRSATAEAGALLIADEVWTGLGRSGEWLWSSAHGVLADIVCLGKGLGGSLPVSVCLGSKALMSCWRKEAEVVHTSTHAGAPLGCKLALQTLTIIEREGLVSRAATLGRAFRDELQRKLARLDVSVRGEGLMLGIDLSSAPLAAGRVMSALLHHGFITSTGGGARDVLILTPPLTITESQLESFTAVIDTVVEQALAA